MTPAAHDWAIAIQGARRARKKIRANLDTIWSNATWMSLVALSSEVTPSLASYKTTFFPLWAQACTFVRSLLDCVSLRGILMFITIVWSLLAFIFLNCVPAHAEWRPISYAAGSGGFSIYIDPAAVVRQGDLVKMLVLYDFRFVQTIKSKSYLSSTWQQQFDCSEHRSRQLSFRYHSDNMGNGKVMLAGDDESNKWSPVAPKSTAAILWNIACSKDERPI